MRIHDIEADRSLKTLGLFLTVDEANELIGELQRLVAHPKRNHGHVATDDFQRELTVAVYDPQDITEFDARVQRLILQDQ